MESRPAYEASLSLGVLSTPSLRWRRDVARGTWGGAADRHAATFRLQFVLCGLGGDAAEGAAAVRAERRERRDLLVFRGCTDTHWYAAKAVLYLRHVVREGAFAYAGLADDDAYVAIERVLLDLRALSESGIAQQRPIAYGAYQWFSYERESGRHAAFGSGPQAATWEWRQLTRIMDARWPGTGAQQRVGARTGANAASLIDPVSPAGRRGLTLPFPFQKGPLMVFSRAAARLAASSNHSRGEQAHAAAVAARRRVRILHDIFLGHVLASDRGGLGAAQLTVVDIGSEYVGNGFQELRALPASRVGTRGAGGCPDVEAQAQRYGSLRVLHLNRKHTRLIARRTNRSKEAVLAACADVLHRHGLAARQQRRARRQRWTPRCEAPEWWKHTGYVVYTGLGWRWCTLRRESQQKLEHP